MLGILVNPIIRRVWIPQQTPPNPSPTNHNGRIDLRRPCPPFHLDNRIYALKFETSTSLSSHSIASTSDHTLYHHSGGTRERTLPILCAIYGHSPRGTRFSNSVLHDQAFIKQDRSRPVQYTHTLRSPDEEEMSQVAIHSGRALRTCPDVPKSMDMAQCEGPEPTQ